MNAGTVDLNFEDHYEKLSELAEAGELKVIPGTIKYGTSARLAGEKVLMTATGASTIDEAIEIALADNR